MTIIRNHKFLAALSSLALMFAFGACSKDKAGEGEGEGDKPGAAKKADAKNEHGYISKKANLVVGIQPAQITGSVLFTDLVEPMIKQQTPDGYDDIKSKCMGSLKSVTIAGDVEDDNDMVIAIKGFDKAQLKACAEASSKASGETVTVTEEGDLTKIASGQGDAAYMGWRDDKTAVMGGGQTGQEKANVEALVKRNEGMSPAMASLVGKADRSAAVWFAWQNPKPGEAPAGVPGKVVAAFGSIGMASGLKLDIGAEAASAEEAQKIVEEMTTQLNQMKSVPQFGKYVAKSEIKADGTLVSMSMALTDAEVKEMVPLVQQQLAPMMMMMMMSAGGGMDMPADGQGGAAE